MRHTIERIKQCLKKDSRGLTSIELIVVLAIFAILSGITIFNYSAFSAGVNLQNTTQQIALRIQQAQTEAISGRYPRYVSSPPQSVASGWKPAYGTYFSVGAPRRFAYFFDQNTENGVGTLRDRLMADYTGTFDPDDTIADPPAQSCGNQNRECLDVVTIETGEHIVGICNDDITATGSCHTNVTISFERPFPAASLIVEDGTNLNIQPNERVTILVLGKNSSGLRGVIVTRLGQIYTKTFTQAEASTIELTPDIYSQGIDLSFFGPAPCIGIQC
jgi:prepilin-type N-terminal cleavage/methylation domain-containing protein